jgi:hypothetical protein
MRSNEIEYIGHNVPFTPIDECTATIKHLRFIRGLTTTPIVILKRNWWGKPIEYENNSTKPPSRSPAETCKARKKAYKIKIKRK